MSNDSSLAAGGRSPSDRPPRVDDAPPVDPGRRRVLGWLGGAGLVTALTAAYGSLAAMMGRFLFPAGPPRQGWMFVSRVDAIAPGTAFLYRTPAGATVNVTRQGAGLEAADFVALSSTCPHLGCQVLWQPQNDRFFCPCHNGVFDSSGVATGGPPAEAGQSLPRYPLRVEDGLLFLEVPLAGLAAAADPTLDDEAIAFAATAVAATETRSPCKGCPGCPERNGRRDLGRFDGGGRRDDGDEGARA